MSTHHNFMSCVVLMFSPEGKIDERSAGVGAESETESLELLANHGRPNDRGRAKFTRRDCGTVGEHVR